MNFFNELKWFEILLCVVLYKQQEYCYSFSEGVTPSLLLAESNSSSNLN